MTIRYKCDSCGSKLNIKEELAGSDGKCPKCKTSFVVPMPVSAVSEADVVSHPTDSAEEAPPSSSRKSRSSAKAKITAESKRPARDEDFDPVSFLMEDDSTPQRQSGVSPLSDDEIPMDLELQMDDDEPRRPNRSRRRVELDSDADMQLGSAAETAGAMLSGGGSSSNAAKDLLTRTVEESRAKSSRLEDDKPRPPSVVQEIAYELFTRGLPGIVAILVVAWFLYQMIFGMMSSPDLPDLERVSGVVTLDGEPLSGARITFRPVEKKLQIREMKTIRVRSSKAFTNQQGHYELKYQQGIRGAVAGEHVIHISKRDGPRELVPPDFSGIPVKRRTVVEGSQEIDFALESNAAQRESNPDESISDESIPDESNPDE